MSAVDFVQGSAEGMRILVVGRCGSGKSSSGNTILGKTVFRTPKRHKEKVTKTCEEHTCHVGGRKVCVIDTPDLLDPDVTEDELQQEKDKLVSLCQSGLHAVLLVVPVGEELENEEEMLEFIKELFSPDIQKFTMVLFTRGDELEEDETIVKFVERNEGSELMQLVKGCGNKVHVFSNTHTVQRQVPELLDKIDLMVSSIGGQFYTTRTRRSSIQTDITFSGAADFQKQFDEQAPPMRLVLLGKTGVGKSASGNTILGRNVFQSASNSTSQTRECSSHQILRGGKQISIIDTPGLFDTQFSKQDVIREIIKCLTYSSPGPHAFLVVISLAFRFTREERSTLDEIKKIFQKADMYTMILFTYKDNLEKNNIEKFLQDGDPALRELVQRCGNRYHCLNNKAPSYKQFKEFMEKLQQMVRENEGNHYTDVIYQDIETAICDIHDPQFKEKVEQCKIRYPEASRTEWQKIYWKLLQELRTEAQKSLLKDTHILKLAEQFGALKTTSEEQEKAIHAALEEGIGAIQVFQTAFRASVQLAKQKICAVQ